jgi:molybdate transport system substrate-binding protein
MHQLILLCVGLLLVSCTSEDNKPPTTTATGPQKELVVFCGITMIDPVRELMTQFEQANAVRMTMSYGGSADLMQSIKLNRTGDIYFPGGEGFIVDADKEGLLTERKQVGVNQAALFVRKGNPKGLTGDLDELLRPGVQVAIGHPDLGSIGKEAKRILDTKGIYSQMVASSAMLQPDSKALSGVLKEGKVDVVLNWKAVLHFQDNADHMEMLPIQGGFATPHKLTMAVVSFSREPELANRFLEFCASDQGRAVFARYGF